MKPKRARSSPILAIALLMFVLPAYSQVTVIFTRHAEKAASPANDLPLTAAGQQRAELLASMLADSGVEAIYVTELQRTQQTAAPLAARVHIKPTVIPANDVQGLVKDIRAQSAGVVVVVGHSNKLPEIIAALGGPSVKIPDPDYNNLFIMTVGPSQSSLLRLHYGSSAPPTGGGMQDTMTPPQRK